VRELTEIRWHARAGQGAKTAAQTLAQALLDSGKSVQAFPEYGPERRGAPLRAFTRFADEPIRRHDGVVSPDLVVVLEPSLIGEVDVVEGLAADGRLLVDGDEVPAALDGCDAVAVPASRLAAEAGGSFGNVVMLGAVAAALGAPPLAELEDAAVAVLGGKAPEATIRACVREGYAWQS
jgi:pyruvate ferredoxin oxidoreductase gamma subunit